LEIGLDTEEIGDIFNDFLEEYSDKCTEARKNEQGLLRYPREWLKPWETCHPACRATVEDMRKQIESAGGVSPTERGLYDRWIASEMSSQMLVATMPQSSMNLTLVSLLMNN
jgi:hypothetical protein